MAAAAVSRAAALLFNENPDATYLNVIDAILSTAEPVASITNIATGGRLDVDAALNYIQTVDPDTSCFMIVGLQDPIPSVISDLKAYPVPFGEGVTIAFSMERVEAIELMVFDVMGRVVYEYKEAFAQNQQQFYWNGKNRDGNDVPDGIYFAQLKIGNELQSIRLMKIKI